MRLGTVRTAGGTTTGLVVGDEVVDLGHPDVGLPGDLGALLALGDAALATARTATGSSATRWALEEVELGPPVPSPPKFLAIGMNYAAHVAELGREPPEHQYWFNKQRSCVVGPGDPIAVPHFSEQVDYEGELGLVIGRRCRDVPVERALEVVAGYTVVNDVSVRDWQWRTPTFTMGKSYDSHGPTGPWLVTRDEVPDPQDLLVQTWVSGELRQQARTDDMVFTCAEMIAYLSTVFWLEPGDVLATGTPAGVGASSDPPRWLVPGDAVRIEIEGVGRLENPVVAGPLPTPRGLG